MLELSSLFLHLYSYNLDRYKRFLHLLKALHSSSKVLALHVISSVANKPFMSFEMYESLFLALDFLIFNYYFLLALHVLFSCKCLYEWNVKGLWLVGL